MIDASEPGDDKSYRPAPSNHFNKLRMREILGRLRKPFGKHKDRLLSLEEVKRILKPTSEAYVGVRTVPLRLIVGSEGRYNDFTRSFLPRHENMKTRWTRVELAYHKNVPLPPVRLYELGGAYFVHDGNHRVSVAASSGGEFIDAEVTSLRTYFQITPTMTLGQMEAAVIEYERMKFLSETHIEDLIPHFEMHFTSPGRYEVILSHILGHREEMQRRLEKEVPFPEAIQAWQNEVYEPVLQAIRDQNILSAFPGRTPADLYVWIAEHRDILVRKHGRRLPVVEAAASFRASHKRTLLGSLLPRIFG
jgi:hypothetical protein